MELYGLGFRTSFIGVLSVMRTVELHWVTLVCPGPQRHGALNVRILISQTYKPGCFAIAVSGLNFFFFLN